MKLTNLKVKGYKCLVDFRLDLAALNLLTGPHGSGKTAVLELFRLLQGAANGSLEAAINSLGGIESLASTQADAPGRITLSFEFVDETATPAQYTLEFTPDEGSYRLLAESLASLTFHFTTRVTRKMGLTEPVILSGRGGDVEARDGRLKRPLTASEEALLNQKTEALKTFFSTAIFLHPGETNLAKLPHLLMAPTGEEGADPNLYALRHKAPDRYQSLEALLQKNFPGFAGWEEKAVDGRGETLLWQQEGLNAGLYPHQLSEGTLRFLWLATHLLNFEPASLILIDQPGVCLNVTLQEAVAGLLQQASTRGQLVVAIQTNILAEQPDAAQITPMW